MLESSESLAERYRLRIIIDIPWNKNTLTKDLNPIGKIPILLQEGIAPIYDSKVIVQYLEYLKQEPLMYPLDPTERM